MSETLPGTVNTYQILAIVIINPCPLPLPCSPIRAGPWPSHPVFSRTLGNTADLTTAACQNNETQALKAWDRESRKKSCHWEPCRGKTCVPTGHTPWSGTRPRPRPGCGWPSPHTGLWPRRWCHPGPGSGCCPWTVPRMCRRSGPAALTTPIGTRQNIRTQGTTRPCSYTQPGILHIHTKERAKEKRLE